VNLGRGDGLGIVDLIYHLGLPEQPEVPEYDSFAMIDLIGELTGIDTISYDSVETGDGPSATLLEWGWDSFPLHADVYAKFHLHFKGINIDDEELDHKDLWSFLYTLKHHGELAAMANLYRHYELAE
jgi:hypothetical protein